MKAFIIFALLVVSVSYFFHTMSVRDEANSNYWVERQAQCRSLGSQWDLDVNGKCIITNE